MNDSASTLADRLGSFGSSYAIPSEEIRRQAVLCVLDTVGCMIAGSQVAEAAALRPRFPSSSSSIEIARYYGYCADVFELNDLISGHASVGNVSAGLALATKDQVTGNDLVTAIAAGIEVTSRCYNAFYPHLKPYGDCSITAVGLPSSAGCSVVAGRLTGLSAGQMRQAVAIGLALANWCPAEVIFGDGGTIKPMLFGAMPASTGIDAAGYAQRDFSGPLRILESDIGYFRMAAREFDAEAFDSQIWALSHPRRKAHACCGYLHSALDSLAAARSNGGLAGNSRVEIRLPAYIHPVVAKQAPPISPNDARFHMAYCAALVICGADVVLPEHSTAFERYFDPRVSAVMESISMKPDPELKHYHHSVVLISNGAGDDKIIENSAPKGSPANPMSDREVVAKFRALAGPVIGAETSEELETMVFGLPNARTTVDFTTRLSSAMGCAADTERSGA